MHKIGEEEKSPEKRTKWNGCKQSTIEFTKNDYMDAQET